MTVAICSVSDDADKAASLAQALQVRGYVVQSDSTPSDDFWAGDTVLERMKGAQAAIVIWSEASSGSALFRSQATAARDRTQLIHVSADGMTPLFPFDGEPAADLSGWDGEEGHAHWRQCLQRLEGLSGSQPSRPAISIPTRPEMPQASSRSWGPSGVLKASIALSVAFLAGAMTSELVINASEPVPPSKSPTSAVKHEAVTTPAPKSELMQHALVRPLPLEVQPEVLAQVEVPARSEVPATKKAEAPSPQGGKAATVQTARTPKWEVKQAKNVAVPKRPARPKIKYAFSENMRLFCERAGRATPECRTFRRNAPKGRRGAYRKA